MAKKIKNRVIISFDKSNKLIFVTRLDNNFKQVDSQGDPNLVTQDAAIDLNQNAAINLYEILSQNIKAMATMGG